jgi:hypothetical protein
MEGPVVSVRQRFVEDLADNGIDRRVHARDRLARCLLHFSGAHLALSDEGRQPNCV